MQNENATWKMLELLSTQQVDQALNSMTEEQVLERVEKAHKAYESSTSEWSRNYWMSVISRLRNRFSTH